MNETELQDTLNLWFLDEARRQMDDVSSAATSLQAKASSVGQLAIGMLGLLAAVLSLQPNPQSLGLGGWAFGVAPLVIASLLGTAGLWPRRIFMIGKIERWTQNLQDEHPDVVLIRLFETMVGMASRTRQQTVLYQWLMIAAYLLTLLGVLVLVTVII